MDRPKPILHHFQENARYYILMLKFKLMKTIQVAQTQNIAHISVTVVNTVLLTTVTTKKSYEQPNIKICKTRCT
jgi:hypothetical protein